MIFLFYLLLDKCGKPIFDAGTSFVGAHVDRADQVGDEEAEDGGWLHSRGLRLICGVGCGTLRFWMRIDLAFIMRVQ